jgi:CRISPR type III-A/MTUBE-associated protein Csm6
MLHICRKYKPDCVMLYLSKEMCERHDRDDRYCDSLRRLAAREGFAPEILVEERPELADVQIYDFFFQEFQPLLLTLHNQFPEHQLILNIASGTPAMKNALYLLAAFLPFPVLPVQTKTPVGKQNPHLEPHMDYDVDLYWECNLDNEDYIDRCQEVQYKNLNVQLQRENILAHLNAYDYAAALAVAKPIQSLLNPQSIALLESAKMRVELNWKSIHPTQKLELGLPLHVEEHMNIAEYLLWLQMKQQRGDYSDFLRGLTPGLFALCKIAVEEKAGYPLSKYCDKYGHLNRSKMLKDEMGMEIGSMLEGPLKKPVGGFLISSHYVGILKEKYLHTAWAKPLILLREIEEKIRNAAAHTITRVDEQWIQNEYKLEKYKNQESSDQIAYTINQWMQDLHPISSEKIMKLIKTAVYELNNGHEGKSLSKLDVNWGAYDLMNQKIEAALAGLF